MTMAQKANSYYDFARDTEAMLSRKGHDEGFADALVPIDTQGEQWLKMATEVLLVAIRPQELVILDELIKSCAGGSVSLIPTEQLKQLRDDSPRRTTPLHSSNRRSACSTGRSSTHPPRNRMGNARSSNASETGFAFAPEFIAMLKNNATFHRFFVDNVRTGLKRFEDLLEEAAKTGHSLQDDRGFVYEHRYKMFEVERLLRWSKQINGSSVGGYLLPKDEKACQCSSNMRTASTPTVSIHRKCTGIAKTGVAPHPAKSNGWKKERATRNG